MCRSNGHQSATGDVLGPTPQAGVRHTPGCLLLMLRINSPCRHPDLPPMRRPATRHCQHRGAGGDRADSQAPWPGGRADRSCASEPGTAPDGSADLILSPMLTPPGHPAAAPGRARVDRRLSRLAFPGERGRFTDPTMSPGCRCTSITTFNLPSIPRSQHASSDSTESAAQT